MRDPDGRPKIKIKDVITKRAFESVAINNSIATKIRYAKMT